MECARQCWLGFGLKVVLLAVVLIGGVGCAHSPQLYEGPKKPVSQVATIHYVECIIIESINGVHLNFGTGSMDPKFAEVLPGKQSLEIGYQAQANGMIYSSTKNVPLTFTAQAGKNYTIRFRSLDNERWYPFVVDDSTNRQIAPPLEPRGNTTPQAPPQTPSKTPANPKTTPKAPSKGVPSTVPTDPDGLRL